MSFGKAPFGAWGAHGLFSCNDGREGLQSGGSRIRSIGAIGAGEWVIDTCNQLRWGEKKEVMAFFDVAVRGGARF